MPLYEFSCEPCDKDFELLIRMEKSEEPQNCPKCGKEGKKKVSRSSFTLKGGGWAADGYSTGQ